jgi:hypothetical protein
VAQIAAEIEEDRATLQDLMDRLGVGRDRVKTVLAWTGEEVERLKLNGELFRAAPLSRMEEL